MSTGVQIDVPTARGKPKSIEGKGPCKGTATSYDTDDGGPGGTASWALPMDDAGSCTVTVTFADGSTFSDDVMLTRRDLGSCCGTSLYPDHVVVVPSTP